MSATSSSARIDAARKALAKLDEDIALWGPDWGRGTSTKDAAAALRALIEPPATEEGPEQIVEAIMASHHFRIYQSATGAEVQQWLTEAVHAGIQAAWESWEPETAMPTDGVELILITEAAALPPQLVCQNTLALAADAEPERTLTAEAKATLENISGAIHVNGGDVYVNTHGAAIIVFDEEQIHVNSDGTTATEDTTNYRTGWEA